jgi:transcriptional regulator with XRE-family HTH domain
MREDLSCEVGPRGEWRPWRELDCRALRGRLRLTQREFACRFNFPVSTLRQWEQGTRRPSGAALALLHVIAYAPAVATRAVIRARTPPIELERPEPPPKPRDNFTWGRPLR